MTMNEHLLRQLLSRFESQEELSVSESSKLREHLEFHPDLIDEVLDRRAIEGMLQLLANDKTAEVQFVDRCLEKLKQKQSNAKIGDLCASESLKLPCSETKPDFQIFDQITLSSQQTLVQRSKHKPTVNRLTPRIFAVLVSSVVAMLAIWSGSQWLGQKHATEKDKNGLAAVTQPDPVGSNSRVTGPVLSDRIVGSRPSSRAENNLSTPAVERRNEEPATRSDPFENAFVDAESDLAGSLGSIGSLIENKLAVEIEQTRPLVDGDDQFIPESRGREGTSKQKIASVTLEKSGRWENERSPEDFGAGEYELVEGSARLKLRNRVLLQVLAPAKFAINDDDSVHLHNGNFSVGVPRAAKQFEILTKQGLLQDPENAKLQLIVDADGGFETFLSRGSIAFLSADEEDSRRNVSLARNGLFQLVVRPVVDNPSVSPVLIARGKNDFSGRIGSGLDSISTDSQSVFANVMRQINEVSNDETAQQSLKDKWPVFAQRFQTQSGNVDSSEFQNLVFNGLNQNIRDVSGMSSTTFQGSFTVNGVEKTFSSQAEYEQALQMLEGAMPPSLFSLPGILNQANNEEPIHVNGQKLEFSSPEKFIDLRRQMSR